MSQNWETLQRQASAAREARDRQRAESQPLPDIQDHTRFRITQTGIDNQNAIAVPRAVSTDTFWTQNPGGLRPLITERMKSDLALAEATITVHSVRLSNKPGKFGSHYWTTEIDALGQRFTMQFGRNEIRDMQMEAMSSHIQQYGPIDAVLVEFETDAGPGWNLAPPVSVQSTDGIITDPGPGFDDVPF